jgi:hypothetical protein
MDMVKDPKPDLSLSAILNAVANQDVQALFSEAAKKAPKITQALSHSAVKVFAQRRDSEGKITAESQATGFYWRADNLYISSRIGTSLLAGILLLIKPSRKQDLSQRT